MTAVDDAADRTSIEKDIVKSDGDFEKEVIGAESVTTATRTEEVEYVSGWKLWSLLVGISSVFILVLLDMAIVATVSESTSPKHPLELTITNRRRYL